MISFTPCKLISSSHRDGGRTCTVRFLDIAIYQTDKVTKSHKSQWSFNIAMWVLAYLLHGSTENTIALVIRDLNRSQKLNAESLDPCWIPLHACAVMSDVEPYVQNKEFSLRKDFTVS